MSKDLHWPLQALGQVLPRHLFRRKTPEGSSWWKIYQTYSHLSRHETASEERSPTLWHSRPVNGPQASPWFSLLPKQSSEVVKMKTGKDQIGLPRKMKAFPCAASFLWTFSKEVAVQRSGICLWIADCWTGTHSLTHSARRFNPVALTIQVKGLNRVLGKAAERALATQSTFHKPTDAVVKAIAQSSNGDLRSAINTLQFLASRTSSTTIMYDDVQVPSKGKKRKRAVGKATLGQAQEDAL